MATTRIQKYPLPSEISELEAGKLGENSGKISGNRYHISFPALSSDELSIMKRSLSWRSVFLTRNSQKSAYIIKASGVHWEGRNSIDKNNPNV